MSSTTIITETTATGLAEKNFNDYVESIKAEDSGFKIPKSHICRRIKIMGYEDDYTLTKDEKKKYDINVVFVDNAFKKIENALKNGFITEEKANEEKDQYILDNLYGVQYKVLERYDKQERKMKTLKNKVEKEKQAEEKKKVKEEKENNKRKETEYRNIEEGVPEELKKQVEDDLKTDSFRKVYDDKWYDNDEIKRYIEMKNIKNKNRTILSISGDNRVWGNERRYHYWNIAHCEEKIKELEPQIKEQEKVVEEKRVEMLGTMEYSEILKWLKRQEDYGVKLDDLKEDMRHFKAVINYHKNFKLTRAGYFNFKFNIDDWELIKEAFPKEEKYKQMYDAMKKQVEIMTEYNTTHPRKHKTAYGCITITNKGTSFDLSWNIHRYNERTGTTTISRFEK